MQTTCAHIHVPPDMYIYIIYVPYVCTHYTFLINDDFCKSWYLISYVVVVEIFLLRHRSCLSNESIWIFFSILCCFQQSSTYFFVFVPTFFPTFFIAILNCTADTTFHLHIVCFWLIATTAAY